MLSLYKSAAVKNHDPFFGRPILVNVAVGHLRSAEANMVDHSQSAAMPQTAAAEAEIKTNTPVYELEQQVKYLADQRNIKTIEDLRSEVDLLYGGNPLYDQQAA